MKKLVCGAILSAACAGVLLGYYDVSTDPNMMGASAMKMSAPKARAVTIRSKATIETEMKNTEKSLSDLDKRISQERNMVTKQELQKQRATQANRLKQLEEELNLATR